MNTVYFIRRGTLSATQICTIISSKIKINIKKLKERKQANKK